MHYALIFAACRDFVPDNDMPIPRPVPIRERPVYDDSPAVYFPIARRAHTETLDLESTELREGESTVVEINLPSTQHYSISINAGLSEIHDIAVVVLSAGNAEQGAFYVRNEDFTDEYLHGIYLEAGINRLSLTALKGDVIINSLTVRDFELSSARFNVSKVPANANSSNTVRLLMDYLGDVFGERVLLAQHVTPGTNTEIGAIYEATGRLPAIRASDLMAYSRSYTGEQPPNDDIRLALEWAEAGGLVSYDWTWYSPPSSGRSHFFAADSDFNLNRAATSVFIADLDTEAVDALVEAGAIARTTYELIREIDHMAENLKRFQAANVPVLWRPMHQAGTGWFWWGDCEPEAYRWLWRLMFERFSDYHGLNNLIWVWAGQSAEFYPGDNFVDIIGEDIFNTSNTSSLPQFAETSGYFSRRRMAAMTECALLPSPDILNRDRAMWLWTALCRGDFLIDGRGRLNEIINTREGLYRAYNHELTITLDKLPQEF
ncbi:MAG: glycoside hydrolase family 26 protein [Oscillospiraceae bacterium]|nr:glycoside hydrolase family 26 protein [Oscillospiraceae bacterium]